MTKAIRTGQSQLVSDSFLDFSSGIYGNVSDLGAPIRHLRKANNVVFDPFRALGIRLGYRDITDYGLPFEPHSLSKYYAATNKVFVDAADKTYSVSESAGYALQTLPVTPSSNWWHSTNINGVLVKTQEGGSNAPIAYNGTAWLSIVYPTPGAAPSGAAAAGGSVDAGLHKYRIRWLFSNGASLASSTVDVTTAAGNLTAALTVIPISARSDYLGFQVERTKLLDTGTYWYVGATLNPATTTYNDTSSDASLGTRIATEPGPYGQAPHFDHLFSFRNRLIGMKNSNLYVSQPVAAIEPGSGVFNFHPTAVLPVSEDDGDSLVTWAHQMDRVVLLKGKSLHALIGFDMDTFQIVPLYRGAGAAGTRSACSAGATVFFYDGADRLYRMDGNNVRSWGSNNIGHYLSEVSASVTAQSKVVLVNYLGEKILVAYPSSPSTYNNEVLKYRLIDGKWEHDTNMRIADALVQARRDDFAGAGMIYCDPQIRSAAASQGYATSPNFIIWYDPRVSPAQFYAQKLSSAGAAQLAANGVVASSATVGIITTATTTACSDTTGSGFIVAYAADQGSGFVALYAQKLDAAGVKQWGTGTLLSPSGAYANTQSLPAVAQDGTGGAVVAWRDSFSSGNGSLRVQRVDSAGTAQWTAGGVVIDAGPVHASSNVRISPDGAGGYYLAWSHGLTARVQRIDSAGAVVGAWPAGNGVSGAISVLGSNLFCVLQGGGVMVAKITAAGTVQTTTISAAGTVTATSANLSPGFSSVSGVPRISADDSGGAIVLWIGKEPTQPDKLYAVRVTAAGVPVWSTVVLWTYTQTAVTLECVSDGAGGVIAAWGDADGPGLISQVHVTHLTKEGALPWGAPTNMTTLLPCTTPTISTDGAGGAIVAWQSNAVDIAAQRVGYDGTKRWAVNGVVVCSASSVQANPVVAFTNAPYADVPAGSAPGYHLWSAYEGTSDARPRNSTLSGSKIAWYAELPEHDAGEPDVVKDYEAIEIHSKRGLATLNANVTLDAGGISNSIPVNVSIAGARWGPSSNSDTLYWGPVDGSHPNNPHTWGGSTGGAPLRTGLPAGMTGRKHALSLAVDTDQDLIVNGVIIDYRRRPDRSF